MNKLCLNSRDELLMLDLDALAYLQANGNYTQVMYIASKGPLVSLGLSRLEAYIRAALPAGDSLPLVRLGRSLLVNQSFLVQISVTSQKLVLSDNAGHPMSTASASRHRLYWDPTWAMNMPGGSFARSSR